MSIENNPFNFDPKTMQSKSAEIQNKMKAIKEKLSSIEVEGESGGGMVKVILNGHYEAKQTIIDPSLLTQPIQILCDLVASAITDATRKVESAVQAEMLKLLR
jgi:DNA-binding YbaB/EbfC family protein